MNLSATTKRLGILVPKLSQVEDYLTEYPGLKAHLPKLLVAASQELGKNAELALEMFYEKDSDDHFLILRVRQNTYPPLFMERIREFSDRHCQFLKTTKGWLQVTTDFQKPSGGNRKQAQTVQPKIRSV